MSPEELLRTYHEYLEEKGVIQKFPNYEDFIDEFINQLKSRV